MRIGFVSPEYVTEASPDGGLANYLAKLCGLLRQRGHAPVVFLRGERNRHREVDGVRVVEYDGALRQGRWTRGLPGRAQLRHWLDCRRMAQLVAREHARAPFDIVQIANYASLGRHLFGRLSAPLVVRMSSYQPMWRAASGVATTRAAHLADWLEIEHMLRADGVFAPSDLVASTVRRLHGVPAVVIRSPFVMPPAGEDETLYRQRVGGRRYLLFFGTMSRLKGADILAEALPEIFTRHPDAHAVFAGGDSRLPDGRRTSALLAERAGPWRDRVHVLGVLPRWLLTPLIRHAAVVTLPSRVDNYPNTCLEAQALGRIVVGTRGSSLDEMIEDGQTGFLSAPESVPGLADAVGRALGLPGVERERMEAAVLDLARQRKVDACVEEHLALYAAVVQRRGAGPAPPAPRAGA